MTNYLLFAICLLFHVNTASSLRASTVRELSGLYSNAKQYVSPVFNGSDPVFSNISISGACEKAILGLYKDPTVAAKCK